MNRRKLHLYCFSPPVMLATFIIEIAFALYIIFRYGMNKMTRLVVAILISLATFQGTEYALCGVYGTEPGLWSKIGYTAITLLPPLGIHLALTIARKSNALLLRTAYMTAAFFIAYFMFYTPAITGTTCYANYVVLEGNSSNLALWLYGAYYYGWLAIGVSLSWYYAKRSKAKNIRHALMSLALGYLAFIVPTTAFNIADPSTIAGIPSIMCGFAVLLAFMLVGKVVPEAAESFRSKK